MSAPTVSLGGATPPRERLPRGTALVTLVVVGSLGLVAATGQPLVGLAPVAAVAAVWALMRVPLRWPLFVVIGLAILADISPLHPDGPDGRPWYPPTYIFFELLIDNLRKITNVDALRFSGMELVLLVGVGYAVLRAASGQTVDRVGGRWPNANVMTATLAVGFVAVLWLEVWGIGRGGDFRQSLWQFRYMLWLPVLTWLLMYAMRGPRDYRALLYVLTVTAAAKVLLGAYYYYVLAKPKLFEVASVTSHADTVLWVVLIAVWIAAAVARPTPARLLTSAAVCLWLQFGIVLNNRRTAYVTLAATMIVLFVLLPRRLKRPLIRMGIYAAPLLAAYVAIGTRKTHGVFAPAAALVSVVTQKDRSSATRDIENFNLIVTLKQGRLLGAGWGHEYVELVKADNIAQFFAQYRYVAHNSVLWLWSIGGLVGFTALWLNVGVATFLAARAHAHARDADERVIAYAALAMITAYLVQAWSDMGVMSWTTISMLAAAYAMTAQLAASNGAWPQHVRWLARGRTIPGAA